MAVRDALVIKTGQEAWEALQLALAGPLSETAQVSFESWSVFRLTSKDGPSAIPLRLGEGVDTGFEIRLQ